MVESWLSCLRREPFAKPRGWLAWGLLGVLLSPLVVGAAAAAFSLLGYDVGNPFLPYSTISSPQVP